MSIPEGWTANVEYRLALRLLAPGFTPRERAYLLPLFAARFSPGFAPAVPVSPTALARAWGTTAVHVCEAARGLLDRGVLVVLPGGVRGLNEDCDAWHPASDAQASAWKIADAYAAGDNPETGNPITRDRDIPAPGNTRDRVIPLPETGIPAYPGSGNDLTRDRVTIASPPITPLTEKKKEQEKQEKRAPAGAGSTGPGPRRPDVRPFVPPDDPPAPGPRTGQDLADYREALRMLRSDPRTCEAIGEKLYESCEAADTRELEGWRFLVAARKVLRTEFPQPNRRLNYFLGIVRGVSPEEARQSGRAASADLTDEERLKLMRAAREKARGQVTRPAGPTRGIGATIGRIDDDHDQYTQPERAAL